MPFAYFTFEGCSIGIFFYGDLLFGCSIISPYALRDYRENLGEGSEREGRISGTVFRMLEHTSLNGTVPKCLKGFGGRQRPSEISYFHAVVLINY